MSHPQGAFENIDQEVALEINLETSRHAAQENQNQTYEIAEQRQGGGAVGGWNWTGHEERTSRRACDLPIWQWLVAISSPLRWLEPSGDLLSDPMASGGDLHSDPAIRWLVAISSTWLG
ncbi:hypothetical protein SO802_029640 [Lithocarpus litseifolius]|uniref:Uncharacterized protein n=1 Tax=Lithocarpus litseifolius TaxID=425828 RepID=A0AAW2BTV1_9ROSI